MSEVIPLKPHAEAVAPWWRHRWPWLLMAGPAIVVVAGSYLGYIAYQGQDALVVGDYYKQGKAINQDLRRDRAASALGLRLALRYEAGDGVLSGRIVSSARAQPGRLLLQLSHATQPEKDVQLAIQPDADGVFRVPLPMLERSRWVVQVESEKRDWRLAGTWRWPAQHEILLQADPQLAPAE
ncbi:cytochrome oxidase assembly protein [Janthinobacterium sp. BJB412]|nr:cytochrome oxidase assembly protein [Janthinobacterium sp. BJB412]